MSLRSKVKDLYKQLLYLGKDYPTGYDKFRIQLREAFIKNKNETDPRKIKALLAQGRYVYKEIEALYALKKYRAMKSRYYDDKNES